MNPGRLEGHRGRDAVGGNGHRGGGDAGVAGGIPGRGGRHFQGDIGQGFALGGDGRGDGGSIGGPRGDLCVGDFCRPRGAAAGYAKVIERIEAADRLAEAKGHVKGGAVVGRGRLNGHRGCGAVGANRDWSGGAVVVAGGIPGHPGGDRQHHGAITARGDGGGVGAARAAEVAGDGVGHIDVGVRKAGHGFAKGKGGGKGAAVVDRGRVDGERGRGSVAGDGHRGGGRIGVARGIVGDVRDHTQCHVGAAIGGRNGGPIGGPRGKALAADRRRRRGGAPGYGDIGGGIEAADRLAEGKGGGKGGAVVGPGCLDGHRGRGAVGVDGHRGDGGAGVAGGILRGAGRHGQGDVGQGRARGGGGRDDGGLVGGTGGETRAADRRRRRGGGAGYADIGGRIEARDRLAKGKGGGESAAVVSRGRGDGERGRGSVAGDGHRGGGRIGVAGAIAGRVGRHGQGDIGQGLALGGGVRGDRGPIGGTGGDTRAGDRRRRRGGGAGYGDIGGGIEARDRLAKGKGGGERAAVVDRGCGDADRGRRAVGGDAHRGAGIGFIGVAGGILDRVSRHGQGDAGQGFVLVRGGRSDGGPIGGTGGETSAGDGRRRRGRAPGHGDVGGRKAADRLAEGEGGVKGAAVVGRGRVDGERDIERV